MWYLCSMPGLERGSNTESLRSDGEARGLAERASPTAATLTLVAPTGPWKGQDLSSQNLCSFYFITVTWLSILLAKCGLTAH